MTWQAPSPALWVVMALLAAAIAGIWWDVRRKRIWELDEPDWWAPTPEDETAQYVDLAGVDSGRIRQIPADEFLSPPPGEPVVIIGRESDCHFAIAVLGLNPRNVVVGEYDWRVVDEDLPKDVRVIVLRTTFELPAIGGIIANLRQLQHARFVRLVL